MYDRILVALDDSASAQMALGEAVRLAKLSSGVVYALSVVDRGRWPGEVSTRFEFEPEPSAASNAATRLFDEANALFRESGVSGKTRAIDAYGESVSEVLARAAEECDADIIVIGTHGRHGAQRFLLGSVAESLVRSTQRPVLLLRHGGSRAQTQG
ncbi:universal stress protein [Paraburkholderia caribensis]|jgi:nucleotide-binding universal stress UspA family protein|uniref:universal stress protein n=1 Tax=Paraburkholderia caribensis TaxID=75105 RepID=UPI0006D48F47|nr:universal stress protein [Paraburkholderia caribensis]ALP67112.1 universal stress protein A [Paraburkholderia caribensis]AMV47689.1 universal stress protein A [Paraburkholderia caribensis]AUT56818.1 universal stress protein A [Paraburkholderia caribensis]CAG9239554.1 Universal stress protein A [Paraburkholderia caribensis]